MGSCSYLIFLTPAGCSKQNGTAAKFDTEEMSVHSMRLEVCWEEWRHFQINFRMRDYGKTRRPKDKWKIWNQSQTQVSKNVCKLCQNFLCTLWPIVALYFGYFLCKDDSKWTPDHVVSNVPFHSHNSNNREFLSNFNFHPSSLVFLFCFVFVPCKQLHKSLNFSKWCLGSKQSRWCQL